MPSGYLISQPLVLFVEPMIIISFPSFLSKYGNKKLVQIIIQYPLLKRLRDDSKLFGRKIIYCRTLCWRRGCVPGKI
jgi:hypothetical protein